MGKTLEIALQEAGPLAPTMTTFWRWLNEFPAFKEAYERARQMQADVHADRMLGFVDEVIKTPSKAGAIRVAADILRWQAEVRDPKKYGPKAQATETKAKLSPDELKKEIAALELELGVKAVPGMNTAPNFTRKPEAAPNVPPKGEAPPAPFSDEEPEVEVEETNETVEVEPLSADDFSASHTFAHGETLQ